MVPYIALFSWPLVSAILFSRYSKTTAVLVTVLAGYLLLPEGTSFDLPVLPPVNKTSIPAISALILATFITVRHRQEAYPILQGWRPRNGLLLIVLLAYIGGEFITALLNSDTLVYGPRVIPGMTLYDTFSSVMFSLIALLPLLLGRKFLATPQAHWLMLKCFVIAALGYSLFILFELRMSPQLHSMVYGYFPHVFLQHAKDGGWRPVVFLSHGLLLGIFLSFAVLSALALARKSSGNRTLWIGATLWLFVILVLSKNLGALAITILIGAIMLVTTQRLQLVFAAAIAAIFLIYPMVRAAHLVPTEAVANLAENVSVQRAESLRYRLRHEDVLLAKANERPLFGWGAWGRNRVYNDRGVDLSVTDGAWVITLGTSGWIGYFAKYGAISLPLFLLALRRRRLDIGPETVLLALLVAANLIDLVPNSSATPLTWLVAGALWGRLEYGRATAADPVAEDTRSDTLAYARRRPVARGERPGYARQNGGPVYSRWPGQ